MSNYTNAKTLDYVTTTNKALGVALKVAESVEATQKEAADKVPGLVTQLKQAGLIDEGDEKRASDQLLSGPQSLDILGNVLGHFQGQLKDAQAKVASATIGEGVDSDNGSSATGHQKNANYVGYRRGLGETSEADNALLKLIDGYRPSA